MPAQDGGIIAFGSTSSTSGNFIASKGQYDALVVKFDNSGNILWYKVFGGTLSESFYGGDYASDGGYIVSGYAQSMNGDLTVNKGNIDAMIAKMDANGNKLWVKSYGGSALDTFMDIAETVRNEIRRGPNSRYQIAAETGVAEAQLCRLMQGKTLTAETMGVLLEYFGFELTKKRRRKE